MKNLKLLLFLCAFSLLALGCGDQDNFVFTNPLSNPANPPMALGNTLTVLPDTSGPINPRISSEAGRFSITLYDSAGDEIQTQTVNRGESAIFNDLADGFYLVRTIGLDADSNPIGYFDLAIQIENDQTIQVPALRYGVTPPDSTVPQIGNGIAFIAFSSLPDTITGGSDFTLVVTAYDAAGQVVDTSGDLTLEMGGTYVDTFGPVPLASGSATFPELQVPYASNGVARFSADNGSLNAVTPDIPIRPGTPLSLTNTVTTFAGTAGEVGTDDGIGTAARFHQPYGLWVEGSQLFITEKDNDSLRIANLVTAEITTLVAPNTFREPLGVVTVGGFAYLCDSHAIHRVSLSDGMVALFAGDTTSGYLDGIGTAARFDNPYALATDGRSLFVADRRNDVIRKVNLSNAEVTTIAGTAGSPGSTDGVGAAARFDEPMSLAFDGSNLYVGDWNNYTVRRLNLSTLEVTTLAGTVGSPGSTDGIGTNALLYGPRGLTTDGTFLYVADFYNRHGGQPIPNPEPAAESSLIRRIEIATGQVTTIAGAPETFGSTDGIGSQARFRQPCGIATDGTSLYVADRINNTIRRID